MQNYFSPKKNNHNPYFRIWNLNIQKFSPSKLTQNIWDTYPSLLSQWKGVSAIKNKLESLDGEQKFLKAISGKSVARQALACL